MRAARSAPGHLTRANRTLLAGLIISLIVLFGITIGAALMPYSATSMDFVNVLQPPSLAHPFGTDSFGRDVLTRVLVGARISLMISFSGVALASVFGTAAGMVAAGPRASRKPRSWESSIYSSHFPASSWPCS